MKIGWLVHFQEGCRVDGRARNCTVTLPNDSPPGTVYIIRVFGTHASNQGPVTDELDIVRVTLAATKPCDGVYLSLSTIVNGLRRAEG